MLLSSDQVERAKDIQVRMMLQKQLRGKPRSMKFGNTCFVDIWVPGATVAWYSKLLVSTLELHV